MKKEFALTMEQGEVWWGGAVMDGVDMPLTNKSDYTLDCRVNETYNQVNGLFTSTFGRFIYVDGDFLLRVKDGRLQFSEISGNVDFQVGYKDLRSAFRAGYEKHCRQTRAVKKSLMTKPQYCTWMHCLKEPSQEKILAYAESIVNSGMPVGTFIIDAWWEIDFGELRFKDTFSNPKEMIQRLHELGFDVMLWVCPFVNEGTSTFEELKNTDAFVREKDGRIAIREWWDGNSAVYDLTSPTARAYFESKLQSLIDLGIDGFKMDAGDAFYYKHDDLTFAPTTPNGQSLLYAELASKYPISELRACVGMGGEGVIQRLCDKRSNWHTREGMGALVPDMLQAGMSGYIYCCADMVGGGQGAEGNRIDYAQKEELFLRACQCASMMPCMQFSLELWSDSVPEKLRQAVKKYAKLRVDLQSYFEETIASSEQNFDPIMRPLAYEFPSENFALVNDCFMLGDRYLVAPIVKEGVETLTIRLPKGNWKYVPDGSVVEGGSNVTVKADRFTLPYFERL